MSLLDQLDDHAAWLDFLAYKQGKGHLSKRDEESLIEHIDSRCYTAAAEAIRRGDPLPPPEKILLNKLGTDRKRTVYIFEGAWMWALKLLAWLLYRFDDRQPPGCYSFRRDLGALKAFRDISRTPNVNSLWCCKLDVSDYFNSIDVCLLMPILEDALSEDAPLLAFLARLLTADVAVHDGVLIVEKRGVMAGTPTAPFLANLYLGALDRHFIGRGTPYARYSDDIILFAQSEQEVMECRDEALAIVASMNLEINWEKAYIAAPGEPWEFLGMSYTAGVIDLSEATTQKLKGKVRRKARALRRWMIRKEAAPERAQRAFIRSFNQKFYDARGTNDLTWARWFFPLITTSDSLREVDRYIQQYVRYIETGRFSAANFRLSYAAIKSLGFRSLVHEYYLFRGRRATGPSADASASSPAPSSASTGP